MQSLIQYRRLKTRVSHTRSQYELTNQSSSSSSPPQKNLEDDGSILITPEFDPTDDSISPRTWSPFHRYRAFTIIWLLVFTQGWISTCDSNVTGPASETYHVSETAQTLATGLFFVGLALGALFAGPLSETFGRNPVYLFSTFGVLSFTLGSALSRNFGSELVTRFLGGLCASPTLSVYGGTLADLFSDEERKARWPLFALSPLLGPVLAPLVGGWIHDAGTDWRWTLWIGLAFGGAAFLLALVVLPETFSPILLFWKAKHLRKMTGNEAYVAPIEKGKALGKRLRTNLTRPATFFTTEAIVIFLGAYLVLIFVINFSFLSGLDFIFTMNYDLSPGITALAFVSIAVGVLIDVSVTPLYNRLANRVHRRQCRAFVKRKEVNTSTSDLESVASNTADHTAAVETLQDIPPELSLLRAAIAAPFLPTSLFWLGWTNYASINPASGYVATVFFGYALSAIFISSYQYIISSYETYSSSALASITMARYIVSAGMVVATRPMYKGIGVHWTMTILGTLALLLVPVPWMLLRYGHHVRAKSKFASSVE
ncbi:putative efflux pump kojT [Pseudocercospora fuligena]|uniref:Putative efflux pump kojT n=1 Tax=Pseudocercospora fuligena TaxID=685502 RepID=A0A8H6VLS8_9PEZI|nr:putative efflux pump kojT [Pseudocercospora fuligena]